MPATKDLPHGYHQRPAIPRPLVRLLDGLVVDFNPEAVADGSSVWGGCLVVVHRDRYSSDILVAVQMALVLKDIAIASTLPVIR